MKAFEVLLYIEIYVILTLSIILKNPDFPHFKYTVTLVFFKFFSFESYVVAKQIL